MGVSRRSHAAQRGVSEAAARKAIAKRRITTLPDDTIDPVDGQTYVEVTEAERKLRRGVLRWKVAGAAFKSETCRFLWLIAPTDKELAEGAERPHGFVHFPKGTKRNG